VVLVVGVEKRNKTKTRSLADKTGRDRKARTAGAIRAAAGAIFTPEARTAARSHAAARLHVRIESNPARINLHTAAELVHAENHAKKKLW